MAGPLDSLRVLELSGIGPAPFCAMVLADLGANVIRVERPGSTPGSGVAEGGFGEVTETRTNAYDVLNRNRAGIAVDLRDPAGVEFIRSLAEDADVLIEGFRPGVAERLGVGPVDLSAANSRLIYGRMTGWGQDGRLAERAGHDLTYLALSGALAHIGRKDQPPTPPLNLVADFGGGGMLLAVGILAALVERGISGKGQVVDAAMVDGAALLMSPLLGAWAWGFWNPERGTNLVDSGMPFYDVYECSDGGWLAVAALEPRFYEQLLIGLGLDGDPTLPGQNDTSRHDELRSRFEAVISMRTRDEWAAHFEDLDACVAPVLTMGEAPTHPHIVDRATYVDVEGVPQPAPAPRFGRTPPAVPTPSIEGAAPAEVLTEWGLSEERVEELAARRGWHQ